MPRSGEYGPRRRLLAAPAHADSLAAWIGRYLEALSLRGVRPLSLACYRTDLAHFHAWCVERGLQTPREIGKPMLERYQRHLFYARKANGAPMTVRRQVVILHSVRLLFRWLARNNHIAANPASDLELPRAPPRTLPEVLTVAEVESILAAFEVAYPVGLLGRAMAEVLYSTGLRRTEVASLQLYDVDLGRGLLHVRRGKGGKPRLVPLGERTQAWLRKYLEEARPELVADARQTALFVNQCGQPVTPEGVGGRIDAAKRRAGVSKRGSCHLFRHTAATLMLEGGADLRFIQELLGHAHLHTTEIYTHVSIDKLKQIHAATHPGAKLGRRDAAEIEREAKPEPRRGYRAARRRGSRGGGES
jgi:integrase/recombinase XerD